MTGNVGWEAHLASTGGLELRGWLSQSICGCGRCRGGNLHCMHRDGRGPRRTGAARSTHADRRDHPEGQTQGQPRLLAQDRRRGVRARGDASTPPTQAWKHDASASRRHRAVEGAAGGASHRQGHAFLPATRLRSQQRIAARRAFPPWHCLGAARGQENGKLSSPWSVRAWPCPAPGAGASATDERTARAPGGVRAPSQRTGAGHGHPEGNRQARRRNARRPAKRTRQRAARAGRRPDLDPPWQS